tara:strand:+ start:5376 stop:6296 length:921 start_codon:yes stop_codon:yes gene_type:complete
MSSAKVLVLGANGMLGKMVALYLDSAPDFDVDVTLRSKNAFVVKNFDESYYIFDSIKQNQYPLEEIVNICDYDYIVNCIGVIKPKINEIDVASTTNTLLINSYFPLEIHKLALKNDINYIQIGTDCVFSGLDGEYTEDSYKDALDLYGKSKIVGEIEGNNKIVIRSSIIGPEQGIGFSLMNWFLNNKESVVSGYKNHMWNGVTTLNFAKIIEGIINSKITNFKTHHLIPKNVISKANLLEQFKIHFNKEIEINHLDADSVINRTLKSNNINLNEEMWNSAGYNHVPTIEENIEELANSELTHKIMI